MAWPKSARSERLGVLRQVLASLFKRAQNRGRQRINFLERSPQPGFRKIVLHIQIVAITPKRRKPSWGIIRNNNRASMADVDIPQAEADLLIAMEKHRVDELELLFAAPGEHIAVPLVSADKRENFVLDVTRSQLKLTKATFQNRARQVIILMRLDVGGPPSQSGQCRNSLSASSCVSRRIRRQMGFPCLARAVLQHVRSFSNSLFVHAPLQYREPSQHPEWFVLMTILQEIENLLDQYRAWLKDKTSVKNIDGTWVEITTPYLDRHNDALALRQTGKRRIRIDRRVSIRLHHLKHPAAI